jgi:hypothetical protein
MAVSAIICLVITCTYSRSGVPALGFVIKRIVTIPAVIPLFLALGVKFGEFLNVKRSAGRGSMKRAFHKPEQYILGLLDP